MEKLITNIFYSVVAAIAVGFAIYAPSFAQKAVAGATPQLYAKGEEVRGYVVGIMDGDTLKLLTDDQRELRVRLSQADAPEKGQDFAENAKRSLSDLAFQKPATIRVSEIDSTGRIIAEVYIGSMSLALTQVGRGMAWVDRTGGADDRLVAIEQSVRQSRIGLWGKSKDPVAPWDYRRQHGQT